MGKHEAKKTVGIDAIAVHVPHLYVDLSGEWAQARAAAFADGDVQQLVGKVKKGVGVEHMAVPDSHEDSATLAAMAAVKAIQNAGINPMDIGYLAVGTETTVDQSKSIAAYVLGMIERRFGVVLQDVGAPQFQFACIGATYALEAAVNMFRAEEHTKPYALVIATDVSKYPLMTAGEYTQGAGAVAMIVSENPRLLAIDPKCAATVTRDERDFFRPNGLQTAVVDGKYSIDVYLDCMSRAADNYLERARTQLQKPGARIDELASHLLFHVPFPRMAEYAALRVLGEAWRKDPRLAAEIVREVPLIRRATESPTDDPVASDAKVRKEYEKQLAASAFFRHYFQTTIEASLTLSRKIGNIYSGSLYLALASLLENTENLAALAGQRIAFLSYGSGASARVFSGVFVDPAHAYVPHAKAALQDRSALSVADYERLHAGQKSADPQTPGSLLQPSPSLRAPRDEFALVRIGAEQTPQKTDVGYRYYEWVSA
jgi:hydroxymethylglutaryl-CoA synthase